MTKIKDLQVFNKERRLLLNVSMDVPKKGCICLLGGSASGKSLMVKYLADDLDKGLDTKCTVYPKPRRFLYIAQQENPKFKHFREKPPKPSPSSVRGLIDQATKAEMILLDEPDRNQLVEPLLPEIAKLKAERLIIIATHHIGWVDELADWIFLLKEGEIYGRYSHEEFFNSKDEFIQNVIIYGI